MVRHDLLCASHSICKSHTLLQRVQRAGGTAESVNLHHGQFSAAQQSFADTRKADQTCEQLRLQRPIASTADLRSDTDKQSLTISTPSNGFSQ